MQGLKRTEESKGSAVAGVRDIVIHPRCRDLSSDPLKDPQVLSTTELSLQVPQNNLCIYSFIYTQAAHSLFGSLQKNKHSETKSGN